MTIGSFLSTLTFTNGWNPRWINQIVPGGWSISVEMTFYLMVPFLHSHLKGFRQSLLATVVVYSVGLAISEATFAWLESRGTPAVPEMNDAFVHYWLPYQLYRFFAGFTLYFLIRDQLQARKDGTSSGKEVIRAVGLLAASMLIFAVSASGDCRRPSPLRPARWPWSSSPGLWRSRHSRSSSMRRLAWSAG